MTVRIAQFVHPTHDVVDEAFLREFPEIETVKVNNLERLSDALDGAEIFHGKTGQTGEGLNVVNEELANARVAECCCYEPELHRVKGDLLLAQAESNEEESERCYQNSLKIALKQSAKSLELRAAMSMSRLWQKQGKIEEARNLLGEVYSWFTEGFDTADLKEAKLLLERLA